MKNAQQKFRADIVMETRAMIQQHGFKRVMWALNGPTSDPKEVARLLAAATRPENSDNSKRPRRV